MGVCAGVERVRKRVYGGPNMLAISFPFPEWAFLLVQGQTPLLGCTPQGGLTSTWQSEGLGDGKW